MDFAYSFVTPLLMKLIPSLGAKNVLSAGIVMGIMIIPMVASLSEDAMRAVPNAMREGAFGLGSTKLEVTKKWSCLQLFQELWHRLYWQYQEPLVKP